MTRALRLLLLLLWGWTFLYGCVSLEALRRLSAARGQADHRPQHPHRWVVLRPLHGTGLPRTLAQLVPPSRAPLHVVYLASASDAAGQASALGAVAQLRAGGHQAELRITAPGGPNGKATQLAQVPDRLLEGAYVLSLDDDVDASTVSLDAAAAALEADPGLGAVWFPFRAEGPAQAWPDRIAQSVLNAGPHAFVLLAALAPQNLTGKAMAYRPEAVRAVGGWAPRRAFYGDDLDLGQALRAGGFGIGALPAHPVTTTRRGQSWREVWQRQHRWQRIIIDQHPTLAPSYLWYMGAAPLLLLGWAGALWAAPAGIEAVVGLGATLGARALILGQLERPAPAAWPRALGVGLLADGWVLAAFGAALGSPEVVWVTPPGTAAMGCHPSGARRSRGTDRSGRMYRGSEGPGR